MRAAVVWHAESFGVGNAPAADLACGLEQDEAPARSRKPSCGGNAGSARPDNDHIDQA
jgi:hypothetical protein